MIPLHDLAWQHAQCKTDIDRNIAQVLDSGVFIGGEMVDALESAIAAYVGVRHAIGVNSGTDALMLILAALGIGEGDEVITTPFSFWATAEAILNVGATPVFVDVDGSYNIDATKIEAAITARTTAILPVHLFGRCAAMTLINDIAKRHGLYVVEDACQAIGATYCGRKAGSLGIAAAFSFYPTKNLGGMGDGGMVVTDDDDVAERVRIIANHGSTAKYVHSCAGLNSRLDAVQAAVLLAKLPHLDAWNALRSEAALRYDILLNRESRESAHHLYCITRPKPPAWARLFYPVPLHKMPCFHDSPYLPVAEFLAGRTFALPCFPNITEEQQAEVIAAL